MLWKVRAGVTMVALCGVVAPAFAADPAPPVKLTTLGMHVGGGPFDEATKEPFRKAVEAHFDELRICVQIASSNTKLPAKFDVGVDLLIEAEGGHPRVSNPRTSVVADGFMPCVTKFFEGVEFRRPKTGKTGVSYSVRFTELGR